MKKANTRITRGSGNVFLDLGFPPHEAAVMLLRCELAEALRKWMAREGLTQAQAAKRLGVVQPRLSEIARNKVDKLSLDYLVGLCAKAVGFRGQAGISVQSSGRVAIDCPLPMHEHKIACPPIVL
jgi:predicted XRE-type DNA-binding protein